MTIAIALKIGDGIILGADSAVTMPNPEGYPDNIYFNSEKIINLVKGLPLGAATYGLGGFGGRSSARVAKDLRKRFTDREHEWWVNPDNYTVEAVAQRVKEFFYDEHYLKEFPSGGALTRFGFMIAGYTPDAAHGEVWSFDVSDDGKCDGPNLVLANASTGLFYRGQGEALNRLIRGWSTATVERLASEDFPADEVIATLQSVAPLWHPAMPLQDGIDLVKYLIQVTAGFVRYMAEPTTVAPPIDLAAITLHESFRWVARKHYYQPELNAPPSVHEWQVHH